MGAASTARSSATAAIAARGKWHVRLDVEDTDDPGVGIRSGAESSDTVARETSTKSGALGHIEHQLRSRRAYRAPDHALVERQAVGDHRVAADTHRPQPAVLETRMPPHRGPRARRAVLGEPLSNTSTAFPARRCGGDSRGTGALEAGQVDRSRIGDLVGEGLHPGKIGISARLLEQRNRALKPIVLRATRSAPTAARRAPWVRCNPASSLPSSAAIAALSSSRPVSSVAAMPAGPWRMEDVRRGSRRAFSAPAGGRPAVSPACRRRRTRSRRRSWSHTAPHLARGTLHRCRARPRSSPRHPHHRRRSPSRGGRARTQQPRPV